jgi:hypothetical protein
MLELGEITIDGLHYDLIGMIFQLLPATCTRGMP